MSGHECAHPNPASGTRLALRAWKRHSVVPADAVLRFCILIFVGAQYVNEARRRLEVLERSNSDTCTAYLYTSVHAFAVSRAGIMRLRPRWLSVCSLGACTSSDSRYVRRRFQPLSGGVFKFSSSATTAWKHQQHSS